MSVHELVAIPVEKLIVDPDFQARARTDPQQVARLKASEPEKWPPLLVTPNPDSKRPGTFLIIDGAHRFLAGRDLEGGRVVTNYPCRVVSGLGYEDSCLVNLTHLGLQLSTTDRKAYAVFLHEQHPDLSARELARRVGLAPSTVIIALNGAGNGGRSRTPFQLPRVLSSLVKAGQESGASPEAKSSHVAKSIMGSKDPEAVMDALDAWLVPLTVGLDRARVELAGNR
jgi:hypothetical protein